MLIASFPCFGRREARSACHCAVVARYSRPPLRVAALRRNSREIVDAARPSRRATSRAKKRDFLPLREREIPAQERLGRLSKHCRWYPPCFPEPSCPYRRRHTGLQRSILTLQAYRYCRPEPSPLISSCHGGSTWRRQWRPPRPIRTPLSNFHRNLLHQGVATTT